MRWWRRRGDRDQDLEREVRSHLELEAEDEVEAGRSTEEAQYAARRAFGNVSRVQEEVREMWSLASLDRFG